MKIWYWCFPNPDFSLTTKECAGNKTVTIWKLCLHCAIARDKENLSCAHRCLGETQTTIQVNEPQFALLTQNKLPWRGATEPNIHDQPARAHHVRLMEKPQSELQSMVLHITEFTELCLVSCTATCPLKTLHLRIYSGTPEIEVFLVSCKYDQ